MTLETFLLISSITLITYGIVDSIRNFGNE